MSVITRNSYGAIAVNKVVIERMIIEDMLGMDDVLVLSNKKGKPIKEKPTPIIDPDYYDAVEVSEKKGEIKVKIYVVVNQGCNISETADKVFEAVENDFAMLRLDKPRTISVKVRGMTGVMNDEILKRNIDIVRNNA
ncbi:MAG: Asp23/Gls24 family envelope stress response protein [Clostridiales bacterium]|nr:Asp23/Gls24 family envelope stress response protein [Clostridiales bacterium]